MSLDVARLISVKSVEGVFEFFSSYRQSLLELAVAHISDISDNDRWLAFR